MVKAKKVRFFQWSSSIIVLHDVEFFEFFTSV